MNYATDFFSTDIPIIQTFSSVMEEAASKCLQISSIKKALESIHSTVKKSSCYTWLEQFEYLSKLIEDSVEASNETNEYVPIIELLVGCLRPLKVTCQCIHRTRRVINHFCCICRIAWIFWHLKAAHLRQ